MKVFTGFILATIPVITSAFAPQQQSSFQARSTLTALEAVNRRAVVATVAAATAAGALSPAAWALGYKGAYVPRFDDLKPIYSLGVTLDNLASNVSDPNKFENALVGLRQFNKDPSFYPGFARNFVSKTIFSNAESDSRVGYIKQAANLISSCQELLDGHAGLEGKEAAAEAASRVKKAQGLVGKFLAESGLEDERFKQFISGHP